ncbi:MAG: class I SAM-dependent methyltransferase [Acidobacteria bacterium]|nr:class I SAM-dependent methyltransferase [Acidobacteriota bacterium]MBU4308144.1 class I SAM-dependent methyltransferase [Acidobacteriota bacterium]MBU4405692.1 class I SAM-dependent methyltransferase [Acidobacteriota bacterium]MCG2811175.1 class I SAM-dependent methyltransferase [Candidatus Aminicenantes bacterium]
MNAEKINLERQRIGTWGALNSLRVKTVLEHAGKKILDAGCASGEYVDFLLPRGYDAYGVDLFPAKTWQGPNRERFSVGDIRHLPYRDGEFDTVLLMEVLEHVPDAEAALREIHRVSRKNLILSVPDAQIDPLFSEAGLAFHHWVDRSHIQFFNQEDLQNLLEKNGFSLRRLERINPIYPELLFFSSFPIPIRLARLLARGCRKLPCRKNRFMTLLAVAARKD